MIVADLTIWSAALRGHIPGLRTLFVDLLQRDELHTPGVVLAQLLSELDDERPAEQLRQWASELPPLSEPIHAWLSAGDLGAFLASRGLRLTVTDACVLTLAVRAGCPLWTTNPQLAEAARHVPLELFQPAGLS